MAKKYEKTLTVNVQTIGDFDETPTNAVIVIDTKLKNRIKQLQRVLKEVKAAYIEDYDYTPTYMVRDSSDALVEWSDGIHHMDCERLIVSQGEFWWAAMIKHTNIRIETEAQEISIL